MRCRPQTVRSPSGSFCRGTLGLPILALAFAGCSMPYITIKDCPDEITIPAPRDANVFLTATVSDASAREVWLGAGPTTREEAAGVVKLSRVGTNEFQLNLSDPALLELVKKQDISNGVRVYADIGALNPIASVLIRVRTIEPVLNLPPGGNLIALYQRTQREIPDSNGTLWLHIDDITGGAVRVSLRTSSPHRLIEDQRIGPGEGAPFEVGGVRYVVGCENLINKLIGNDLGRFRVCRDFEWEHRRAERFIDRVGRSDAAFLVSVEELTGPAFAGRLNAGLGAASEGFRFDTFFETVANAPAADGRRPQVRIADGSTIDLATWWKNERTNRSLNTRGPAAAEAN